MHLLSIFILSYLADKFDLFKLHICSGIYFYDPNYHHIVNLLDIPILNYFPVKLLLIH